MATQCKFFFEGKEHTEDEFRQALKALPAARVARYVPEADALLKAGPSPDQLLRKVIKEIPGISDKTAAEIVRASQADPDALLPLLHGAIGRKKVHKLLELFRANLLSAFSTDVANISGNLVEQHVELAETGLSSGLDWALQSIYGGNRARFRGEMGAEWAGSNQAFGPALKKLGENALNVVVKGKRKPIDPNRPFEHQLSALDPKGLGRYSGRVFGKLEVMDDFFRAWGGGGALAKQAFRKASAEMPDAKPKDIAKRTDQILQEIGNPENGDHVELVRNVERENNRRLFQEKRAGTATEAVTDYIRRHPLVGLGIPFSRTPGNIAARILERSPIGFVKASKVFAEFKAVQAKHANGEATIAEVNEARGKVADALAPPILGTALLAAFAIAARAGLLTGGGPTDEKDRNTLRDTGWSPYSIVFPDGEGGKIYVPYNRLEPVSSLVGFAADMNEAKSAKDADDLLSKGISSFAQNLTSKAYLQQLSKFGELVSKNPRSAATGLVRDLTGAVVPNIVARGAQALDPTFRDTKPEREGLSGVVETVGKNIAIRIPGLDKLVPEKRAGTGEVVARQGSALTRFASPVQPSRTRRGRELEKLMVDIDAVNPEPPRMLTIPKTDMRIRLTSEEYAQLQDADKQATEFLRRAIVSTAFRSASPDDQKQYVKKVYARVGTAARNRLLASPGIRKRAREAAKGSE